MAKNIVGWVILLPLFALLIIFALANRQLVVVNFNPFISTEQLTAPGYGIPLFLVIYLVLLIGVLGGGVATWFAQGRIRQEKRHWRREAEHLTRENEALRRSVAPHDRRGMTEVDDILDRP